MTSKPRPLWIHVQSDEFSVSVPRRFKTLIQMFPADRLIRVDPALLFDGVFFGSARACTIRLEEVPQLWPQFAIRYNAHYECRLMGFGCAVFYNGTPLDDQIQTLNTNDTVICDPYLLRIVPKPDALLQELVERLTSAPVAAEPEDDEPDFRLIR